MQKFNSSLTDSPLNEGSFVEIDINTVKPGTQVAILMEAKTDKGYKIADAFKFDTIVKVTPKKTKIIFNESGERKASCVTMFEYREEMQKYNTMLAKRQKYINYIQHIINGLTYDSDLRYYCSRNLTDKVLALKDEEFEKQYNAVKTSFDYARVYLTELGKEKESYEKEHGRYCY